MLCVSLDYCIQLPSPKQNHTVAVKKEANTNDWRHGRAYKAQLGSWVAKLAAVAGEQSWGRCSVQAGMGLAEPWVLPAPQGQMWGLGMGEGAPACSMVLNVLQHPVD